MSTLSKKNPGCPKRFKTVQKLSLVQLSSLEFTWEPSVPCLLSFCIFSINLSVVSFLYQFLFLFLSICVSVFFLFSICHFVFLSICFSKVSSFSLFVSFSFCFIVFCFDFFCLFIFFFLCLYFFSFFLSSFFREAVKKLFFFGNDS